MPIERRITGGQRGLQHRLGQRRRGRGAVEASLRVPRIGELHDDDILRLVTREEPDEIWIVLLRRVPAVHRTSWRPRFAGEKETTQVRLQRRAVLDDV